MRIVIRPEMTASDIEGLDSISHVNLIMAIEARFNFHFGQKEFLTFRNVGDITKTVEKKTASGASGP